MLLLFECFLRFRSKTYYNDETLLFWERRLDFALSCTAAFISFWFSLSSLKSFEASILTDGDCDALLIAILIILFFLDLSALQTCLANLCLLIWRVVLLLKKLLMFAWSLSRITYSFWFLSRCETWLCFFTSTLLRSMNWLFFFCRANFIFSRVSRSIHNCIFSSEFMDDDDDEEEEDGESPKRLGILGDSPSFLDSPNLKASIISRA